MELLHFDIETCGEYQDFDTFNLSDEIGSKLFIKKYDKMNWVEKHGSIENAYLREAPLLSTYGKICCISTGYINDNGEPIIRSLVGDEKYIVETFNNFLKKIEIKNFKIGGYSVNHFDIPWLLHKLHKYRIVPSDIIKPYNKKPWDLRIFDLYDDWRVRLPSTYTFEEVSNELGLISPKDLMDGSMVHSYFYNGDIDKIKTYCEKDVKTSIEIAKIIY